MTDHRHVSVPAHDPVTLAEAGEFACEVEKLESGAITADEFSKYRLMRGVYGIRGAPDHHMIRVKIPGGLMTAEQLDRMAHVTERFSDPTQVGGGLGHVTTRQNLQFHWIRRSEVAEALGLLAEVGITTREACSNTVRNITACALSGICRDEPFDTWAYSRALTTFFLRNGISQNLPRKFKIAFSGCPVDCGLSAIHDIGIVAAPVTADGEQVRGFRLYIGGGLGPIPRQAIPLEPWTPADELLVTCEAVVRVFDRHGNRQNRNAARLKFVVEKLGADELRRLVLAERATLLRLDPSRKRDPVAGAGSDAAAPPPPRDFGVPEPADLDYQVWKAGNVSAQRQAGYNAVFVALPAGDVTPAQMRGLADIARRYGNDTLSATQSQNILLRWVPDAALPLVWPALKEIGLGRPGALWVTNVVGCPGAQTCNIAVTRSHQLAYRIIDRLIERPDLALDPDLAAVKIKISGCPNSCGHHHIADIGMFGNSRSKGGRFVPSYQVLLGGHTEEGVAEFGRPFMRVPAKAAPDLVVGLLETYRAERAEGESFRAWVRRLQAGSGGRAAAGPAGGGAEGVSAD